MTHDLEHGVQASLFKVKKPYQYIGSEYLSYNKEWMQDDVTMALAFPDKYEIAISNLGQRILYDVINQNDNLIADRVYAPDFDFRQVLTEENIPLYSLEAKKNIKDFDFIGFSLQYELCYPIVLEMLNLSGIAVKNSDRTLDDPIVTAGGPCCYNPDPMSDFIDLFMIGDGEEVIVEIMQRYKELKAASLTRDEIIKELSNIDGVYSPLFPRKTRKRIVQFEEGKPPIKNPIPYSSSVHDRTVIEIRRGCGRMCRFCQPGHLNLPIRERKAEDIINLVKGSVEKTGYDEYSLLSLSSNDYTNIESVIEELSCTMNVKRVSASLPSQRVDSYSTKLANLVHGVRKSTITLAPEAGSQRLRDVINKNLTEDQIIDAILSCYSEGYSSIKLYFIIGLPTETYEDLDEMAELLSKIRYRAHLIRKEKDIKNPIKITCTASIFVPKPFTPFQWHRQNSAQEIREKLDYLLSKTKPIKGVKINYHNSYVSKLESMISRGDKKIGEFVYRLYDAGAYMTTWDENIDKDLWDKTAQELGFSIDELATRQYSTEENLPWDIIDMGIEKEWFAQEYKKALENQNTIPCEFNCVGCGVCENFKVKKVIDKPYEPKLSTPEIETEKEPRKFRIKLTKENELRYLSHLDWQNTLIKTLYRSGLKLVFSQGFNPSPKISLGIALPIFIESKCELVDIEIYDEINEQELKNILQGSLPENIKVLDIVKMPKETKAIDITAQWALYEFEPFNKKLSNLDNMLYIIDKISSSDELFIEKKSKKGIKKLVNIRPSIKSTEIKDGKLQMILKVGQNQDIPSVKADEVIKLFYPEDKYRITRIKFFDQNLSEL